jgi:ornithine carbamoyltransferase
MNHPTTLIRAMRHFLDLLDVSAEDLTHLLETTARLKAAHQRGKRKRPLKGKVLGLVFEKPSLRTRVSFEAAMDQLGGSSIYTAGNDVGLGKRESVADVARVMSEYVDAVVLRTFSHATVEEYAAHSRIPVINGLSDYHHPCQALADLFTVYEVFGTLRGKTLAFIGDGNNVARSLAIACAKLGVRFVLAAPEGYGFDEPFLQTYRRLLPGGELIQNGKPGHAVSGADVIYTDVWTSMGQEAEREQRLRSFAGYQVNAALLTQAPAHARLMHCLPAHRGEEVTSDVIDGERSVVFQQAANRMHAQKALLQWLLR